MRNAPVNKQLGGFWDASRKEILKLGVYELESLGRTCHFFRSKINEELTRRKPWINELVRQIVCGEEITAKATLEIDPTLLLWKAGEATDYSGRQIRNLTPFQTALCAGDTDMIEMILPYFNHVPNGQAAMKAQFAEIFPDKTGDSKIFPNADGGLEGHFKRQKENVFDFSEITTAIDEVKYRPTELQNALNKVDGRFTNKASEEPLDPWRLTILRYYVKQEKQLQEKPLQEKQLKDKLDCFRENFTEKSHAEVVFNREHMLKAYTIYHEKLDAWNWDQRTLFWRQVIGFVQRFLPACDAQAFAQGIYYLTERHETFRRSFDLRHGGGSFYPVDFNSCSGLGFDSAYDGAGHLSATPHFNIAHLERLISNKNTQLSELIQISPHCVIL